MEKITCLQVLLACIIFVSGCVGQSEQSIPPAPTEAVRSTAALKDFTIEGSEYEFSPSSIAVNRGDRVKITFRNAGKTGHSFVVEELGVSTKVVSPGSTATVEFTADRSGTFAFHCSVPGHRSAGMEGQISITVKL